MKLAGKIAGYAYLALCFIMGWLFSYIMLKVFLAVVAGLYGAKVAFAAACGLLIISFVQIALWLRKYGK